MIQEGFSTKKWSFPASNLWHNSTRFGSLSCMNLCVAGKTSLINRTSIAPAYSSFFMIPSNMYMYMPALPLRLIPAHTCTFVGCLGLYVGARTSIYTMHVQYIFHNTNVIICSVHYLGLGCGALQASYRQSTKQFNLDCAFTCPYHLFKSSSL